MESKMVSKIGSKAGMKLGLKMHLKYWLPYTFALYLPFILEESAPFFLTEAPYSLLVSMYMLNKTKNGPRCVANENLILVLAISFDP